MDFTIRAAREEDAPALAALYAPYVNDTAVTFEYVAPDAAEFARRIRQTLTRYPYLVAQDAAGSLLAYAYAGPFQPRPAYSWAAEISLYVRQDLRGQGLGRACCEALERALKAQGVLNLYACVACPQEEDAHLTEDSLRFHERMGYRTVGRFNRCGYKFDTWYDMVWMEKELAPHGHHQPPVRAFPCVQSELGLETLTLRPLTADAPELPWMAALYERAFPANERRPLMPLFQDQTGTAEVLLLEDGGVRCGFLALLNWRDLSHIIYFATDETLRNRGYGARALALLRAHKPGCRILADVEATLPDAPNLTERQHRHSFYLRNGFEATPVRYDWHGDSWEILSQGGPLTGEEFGAFWDHIESSTTLQDY